MGVTLAWKCVTFRSKSVTFRRKSVTHNQLGDFLGHCAAPDIALWYLWRGQEVNVTHPVNVTLMGYPGFVRATSEMNPLP